MLLKNVAPAASADPVLPLSRGSSGSIVMIGGHADVAALSGGGSASTPPRDSNAVTCGDPSAKIGALATACAVWYKSSPPAATKTP